MNTPQLYILMRTDMDSMNPGKAMAQAAHAANQFRHEHEGVDLRKWENETRKGFGTTIVLGVGSEEELQNCIEDAQQDSIAAGIVHDPTYPLKDGTCLHLIPVNTCGYVFTTPDKLPFTLGLLRLHP